MGGSTMKMKVEPKTYTKQEVLKYAEGYVAAYHRQLERDMFYHQTFGEWKKENPTHPLAIKNYPEEEYVQVISAYKKYFDAVCAKVVVDADF